MSTHMPHVSIIVPVYKVEEYLHRCIDSVLDQSYDAWELILIDDGSPDASGAICDTYASADPRIRVIHQTNAGVSGARNTGLDVANGTVITFLDSDDWWHCSFLESSLALLEQEAADIAISRFTRTQALIEDGATALGRSVVSSEEALDMLLGPEHSLMTVVWGKLFLRSVLGGLRFPTGRLHEDEFFSPAAYLRSERVVISNAVHYYYWQRPDSIMGSGYDLRRGLDSIAAGEWLRQEVAGYPGLKPKATEQLMRRLVHQYRWLVSVGAPAEEITKARTAIKNLRRESLSEPHGFPFRVFSLIYAKWPALARRTHSLYLTVWRSNLRKA